MNRVVIIGAGFAGLSCAKELAGAPAQVTLIDQHNFHTFQPLLYQVATAGLNAADVAYSVRGIFHRQDNVDFRQARVTGVDWDAKQLELDGGQQPALPFDRLVVAAGASAAFFGIDGAAEHSFPLYTLTDSIALRNHLLACFEAADADPSLIADGVLTFVVVGGGPTGVEVAGALAELFAMVLRKDFRHLDVSKARILLVEMADHLLTPFKPGSRRHARDTLEARGVDVRTGATVQRVTATRVVLASGEEIPCHTLVWAAGVRANPLADTLGVETTRAGRIVVGPDLRIVGHPDAFAVGDVAAIGTGDNDEILPMLAQVAIQSGRHAAREMVRSWRGAPSKRFRYFDKGIMATIGRNAAVAELPGGVSLSGVLGWLAWLGLHLIYLVGFRNRLSVLINWGWNYLTWDRGPRLIIATDQRDELPP
jgi:NADH dehydrogenase